MAVVREAEDQDVGRIRELFTKVYGEEYPFPGFYDDRWLKKSIYDDNTIFLIAEAESGEVVATGSAMLAVGGLNDLICEFGRLVSTQSKAARGAALELCGQLIDRVKDRAQFIFAEVRTVHPGSQRLCENFGWNAVGFEPQKYQLAQRESMVFYASLQGIALELRRNNPHVIPEVAVIAKQAMVNMNLPVDCIVEDEQEGYPTSQAFALERLQDTGVTSLLRIERGRVSNREVFGNFSLSHGFFAISDSDTHYLVARDGDAVLGAIGYTWDPIDLKVRIFELIEFDDAVKGYLLAAVDRIAREEHKAAYIEVDISAYSPRMQRTLEQLGFVPVVYCPSMVFDNVERLDVVRMAKLCIPYDPGRMRLREAGARMQEVVEKGLEDRLFGMEVSEAARKSELFCDLPDGELHHLARIALLRSHECGTQLIRHGDHSDKLYILVEGEAEVRIGEKLLATLGPGTVLGEMGLVEDEKRSADVFLVGESKVAEIPIPRLERLMLSRPRLGYAVMRKLARSLSRKLRKT